MVEFELDLGIFIVESLANNPKAYKYIDETYNKDIEKYREIAKKNKYYNSKIANEGSIMQTYYFKKLLGMINNTEVIFELLKRTYKYSYQYVVSNEKISIFKFFQKLIRKNEKISQAEENGNLLSCMIFAQFLDKEIIQDEVYNNYILSLKQRLDRENLNFNLVSIDNLDKEDKELLRKIELNLKRLYLKSYEPFCHVVKANQMEGAILKQDTLSDLDKKIICYEYVYDLEGLSLISIVGKEFLKSKDIQELIYCWSRTNDVSSLEKIDYKDLYLFIATAIQIRYLLKSYNQSKVDFFKNFDEDLNLCMKVKDNKIESLEKENMNLKNENEILKKEIELLKSKKEFLEKEVNSFENSKKELVELRNYIFNQDVELQEEIDNINLNEIKGVIFGGHPNWISKMKNILEKWTFVPTESINFDENIIKNNEYIFINTNYISHAFYYKVIKNITDENKLRYINSINIVKSIEDIKKSIHE